jgi:hypothetical protein
VPHVIDKDTGTPIGAAGLFVFARNTGFVQVPEASVVLKVGS